MGKPILKVNKKFYEAKLLRRYSRFLLEVNLNNSTKRVYLANPGGLSTVLRKGRKVLLLKAKKDRRKSLYDVFAVKVKSFWVTVQSTLANRIFEAAVKEGYLAPFKGCRVIKKEVKVKGYGVIDFLLRRNGKPVFVEVKSCTHVEDGTAKFPDKPTGRGRRHVEKLIEYASHGFNCWIVFVVQRPDAEKFKPFWKVDKRFAESLNLASKTGVGIVAFTTEFKPTQNTIFMVKPSIPILLKNSLGESF